MFKMFKKIFSHKEQIPSVPKLLEETVDQANSYNDDKVVIQEEIINDNKLEFTKKEQISSNFNEKFDCKKQIINYENLIIDRFKEKYLINHDYVIHKQEFRENALTTAYFLHNSKLLPFLFL